MNVKSIYQLIIFSLFFSAALSYGANAQSVHDCTAVCSGADTSFCWQCQQQGQQQGMQQLQQQIVQQQQANQQRMQQDLFQNQTTTNCSPNGLGGFNCRTAPAMYR